MEGAHGCWLARVVIGQCTDVLPRGDRKPLVCLWRWGCCYCSFSAWVKVKSRQKEGMKIPDWKKTRGKIGKKNLSIVAEKELKSCWSLSLARNGLSGPHRHALPYKRFQTFGLGLARGCRNVASRQPTSLAHVCLFRKWHWNRGFLWGVCGKKRRWPHKAQTSTPNSRFRSPAHQQGAVPLGPLCDEVSDTVPIQPYLLFC